MKTLRLIGCGLFAVLLCFAMGSWDYYAAFCRCANRYYNALASTGSSLGLRLALK